MHRLPTRHTANDDSTLWKRDTHRSYSFSLFFFQSTTNLSTLFDETLINTREIKDT